MKRSLAANPQCSVQVILRWIAIVVWSALGLCEKPAIAADVDPVTMAQSVTIHRDDWGVPHIYGTTDASIAFGMAYAQCEDYFWQLEDTYIQSLGRYAEIHGESGLNNDLLHRTFEIDRRSSLQNVQNCKGQDNMLAIYLCKKSCISTSSQAGK